MTSAEPERIAYYEGPQYIDADVYKRGLVPRQKDFGLRSICGRYVWMYYDDDDELFLEEPERDFGFISLSLGRSDELIPENITGRIRVHEYAGKLQLKKASDQPRSGGNCLASPAKGSEGVHRATSGIFEVTVEWDEAGRYGGLDDMYEEGHKLTIGEVKDDNGCPFVMLELDCGRSVATYVGKRQKSKKAENIELLSTAECLRLGMEVEDEEEESGSEDEGKEEED
ncbi:hypothetical protein NM688_g4019 [Phlebia brevispora]|uniref:Uncharacterized protein n=1 Tax=Phlebia brevispora TaxID=194682 RepID=A0ACC1T3T9_9APHY|nr:hypothetical protein NM688_g4019 [Phlebia brevispora]